MKITSLKVLVDKIGWKLFVLNGMYNDVFPNSLIDSNVNKHLITHMDLYKPINKLVSA